MASVDDGSTVLSWSVLGILDVVCSKVVCEHLGMVAGVSDCGESVPDVTDRSKGGAIKLCLACILLRRKSTSRSSSKSTQNRARLQSGQRTELRPARRPGVAG